MLILICIIMSMNICDLNLASPDAMTRVYTNSI